MSGRIQSSRTADFAIIPKDIIQSYTCLNILRSRATIKDWTEPPERQQEDALARFDLAMAVDSAFYFTTSAIVSIVRWPEEIASQDSLLCLVTEFLDPTENHYDALCSISDDVISSACAEDLFVPYLEHDTLPVKLSNWSSLPIRSEAAVLLNLLLLSQNSTLELIESFLRQHDTKTLLNYEFKYNRFTRGLIEFHRGNYTFEGTLLEILAQSAFQFKRDVLKLLFNYSEQLVDCSPILTSYVGSHGRLCVDEEEDCVTDCTVLRLLRHGANPNISDYRVTPLQIAVASWDSNAVKYLLEAGADPNALGNIDGILWKEKHILEGFNHLHGASPLYICRQLDAIYQGYSRSDYADKDERKKIQDLLLQYGGKEMCNTTIPLHLMRYKDDNEEDDEMEVQDDDSFATPDSTDAMVCQ
jgi:hypothetical protein